MIEKNNNDLPEPDKRTPNYAFLRKFGRFALLLYILGLPGSERIQRKPYITSTGQESDSEQGSISPGQPNVSPVTDSLSINSQPEFIRHIDPNLYKEHAGVHILWEYIPEAEVDSISPASIQYDEGSSTTEEMELLPAKPTPERMNIRGFVQDFSNLVDSLSLNIRDYSSTQSHGFLAVQGPLADRILSKVELVTPIIVSNLSNLDSIQTQRATFLKILESQKYYNKNEYKSALTVALAEYYITIYKDRSYKQIEDFGFTFNVIMGVFGDQSVFDAMHDYDKLTKSKSYKSKQALEEMIRQELPNQSITDVRLIEDEVREYLLYKIAYKYAHGFVSSIQQYKKEIVISESDIKGNPFAKFVKGVIAINAQRILVPMKQFLDTYL